MLFCGKVACMRFAIPIIVLLLTACERPPTAEQIRSRIGTDASLAATMLVGATRNCNLVGISQLKACSDFKGSLVPEVTASTYAGLALDMYQSFLKDCQTHYNSEYCYDLLSRAVDIERRKPYQP